MVDVLVVDDDEGTRMTLTKMLERAGFVVTAVDNGLAAIAELEQQPVRAIVCDIQLPFLEGGRFYDELSGSHPAMAEKVVFVTGRASDEYVSELIERSGRQVVHKPVNINRLVSVVRSMVEEDR